MNMVKHYVVGVVKPPFQRIDDEYCCWEAVIKIDRYGHIYEETVRAQSKDGIERLTKVGREYMA